MGWTLLTKLEVECIAGLKETYAYYDGEEIDWDWDLNRSERTQADIDRHVASDRRRAGTYFSLIHS